MTWFGRGRVYVYIYMYIIVSLFSTHELRKQTHPVSPLLLRSCPLSASPQCSVRRESTFKRAAAVLEPPLRCRHRQLSRTPRASPSPDLFSFFKLSQLFFFFLVLFCCGPDTAVLPFRLSVYNSIRFKTVCFGIFFFLNGLMTCDKLRSHCMRAVLFEWLVGIHGCVRNTEYTILCNN